MTKGTIRTRKRMKSIVRMMIRVVESSIRRVRYQSPLLMTSGLRDSQSARTTAATKSSMLLKTMRDVATGTQVNTALAAKSLPSDRNIDTKDVDEAAEIWWDHDENCHGPYKDFVDEPDYQEEFFWLCCDKSGANRGCMMSNHKTKTAIPQAPSLLTSNKRKAEEEIVRPATYTRIL
jgi:hypothetical protein